MIEYRNIAYLTKQNNLDRKKTNFKQMCNAKNMI